MRAPEFLIGDAVQWRDLNGEEPVVRRGTVWEVLSEMYLVLDTTGVHRFVFKKGNSLVPYKAGGESA